MQCQPHEALASLRVRACNHCKYHNSVKICTVTTANSNNNNNNNNVIHLYFYSITSTLYTHIHRRTRAQVIILIMSYMYKSGVLILHGNTHTNITRPNLLTKSAPANTTRHLSTNQSDIQKKTLRLSAVIGVQQLLYYTICDTQHSATQHS